MRTWGLGPRWWRLTCRILRKQHMELEATAPGGSDQWPSAALLIPIQYGGGTATFPGAGGTDRLETPCAFLWRADWPSFFPLTQLGWVPFTLVCNVIDPPLSPPVQAALLRSRERASWFSPGHQESACSVSSAVSEETKERPEGPPSLLSSNLWFSLSQPRFKKMHDHTFLN